MFQETISNQEVNDLPLVRYEGRIQLIQKIEDAEKAAKILLNEKVLGFDTESQPTFKKGDKHLPALIQLGTEECVYLFQLNHLKSIDWALPILTNSDILKVGVALHDDIIELQEFSHFIAAGFLNIPKMSQNLGISNTGLRKLTAIILKSRVSKGSQVSNWGNRKLSVQQIQYAATDAWISLKLYKKLLQYQ